MHAVSRRCAPWAVRRRESRVEEKSAAQRGERGSLSPLPIVGGEARTGEWRRVETHFYSCSHDVYSQPDLEGSDGASGSYPASESGLVLGAHTRDGSSIWPEESRGRAETMMRISIRAV